MHRDVKPANVLLARDDHAYLTDFGIVKELDATAGQTRTGEIVGTFDYVAPERIKGEAVGPASDLYSRGALVYFALAVARALAKDPRALATLAERIDAAGAESAPSKRRSRPRPSSPRGRGPQT